MLNPRTKRKIHKYYLMRKRKWLILYKSLSVCIGSSSIMLNKLETTAQGYLKMTNQITQHWMDILPTSSSSSSSSSSSRKKTYHLEWIKVVLRVILQDKMEIRISIK